jgi:predicted CXXCH cytochrome family protein
VRVSGREYNGLIESPCYKGGKFSCLSCHSLHESEPDDQLAAKALGNGACLQCHERLREPSAMTAHTRHQANSSGSLCYNCHMPHTTYGILKSIRSHQISSPRVSEDLASGRPNACNLCHLDKTFSWTAGKLAEWYHQPSPTLAEDQTTLSRIADLALRGDAGQRALAAWHLGWDEALRASSTNWTKIILGQLLDDPYAAVRYIAERSLPPANKPKNYDFTVDPRAREAAREGIWRDLNLSTDPQREDQTVLIKGGAINRERIDRLVHERNERPIRLRE